MSRLGIRPRFEQDVDLDPDAAQKKISAYFGKELSNFEVKSFPHFLCLRLPEEDRHYWSPRLNLSFYEEGETTRIEGIYGPNANVWGMFLYGYIFLGFLAIITGVLGISQWVIGTPPRGLWFFGLAMMGVVLLYLFARLGRRLGARQTIRLHHAYQKAIGQTVSIR